MGFFDKVKGFISKPAETFRAVQGDTLGDTLKYAAIWYVIFGAILGLIMAVTLNAISDMEVMEDVPDWLINLGFALIPIIAILLSIFGVLGILIFGAWQHLTVHICGGRKGYTQTVKAGAYGATPSYLIGWMPILFIGPLVGGIGSMIVTIIGLRELHEISTGRAISAWLLAVVPILILSIISVIISGGLSS